MREQLIALGAGFRARFPWLGGDLQTLRNTLLGDHRTLEAGLPVHQTLHLPTEDGPDSTERLLARLHPGRRAAPLIVLVHGLTGCESSPHMVRSAQALSALGHAVLRLNLRGAGPGRSVSRDIYHAGRVGDLVAALSALPKDATRHGIVLVGYSLGGAAVLSLMGQGGGGLPIRAAVSVSAPLDLAATSRHFMRSRNRLYHHYLLRRMLADAGGARLDARERAALAEIRSVWDFDDRFIAPRFGFGTAERYYAENSPLKSLRAIDRPTLLIHALDDPWVPSDPYRQFDWAGAPRVIPLLLPGGGHVGFHDRAGPPSAHDRLIATFLEFLSESEFGGGVTP